MNRRVAGLTLPLRIALAAQSGGAGCVEIAAGAEECEQVLEDRRLKIPVRSASAADTPPCDEDLCVEVPWNAVFHRDLLRDLANKGLRGVRRLLDETFVLNRPFAFDPICVVDRPSARKAEKMLLHSLRKPQDGWTSTHLNRHISLFITRWLTRTPLRPNQLSVAILAVGLLGAYLASRGSYGPMVVGALLFQAQSVLDGCDGELSRVTYRGSKLGEWLDTIGDDLTNYGFFAGAGWGLYTATGSRVYLIAGAVTVFCGLVTSAIEYRYLIRIGSGDLLKYPLGIGSAPSGPALDETKGWAARVTDLIAPLFKRDTFVLLTLLGTLVGVLGPILLIFAAGGVGILLSVVRAEVRMARERTAPG